VRLPAAALQIFYIIQSKTPSFLVVTFFLLLFCCCCMSMFNKSRWLSMGTIIRYPQGEILKNESHSILYFSDPVEMAFRAVASPSRHRLDAIDRLPDDCVNAAT